MVLGTLVQIPGFWGMKSAQTPAKYEAASWSSASEADHAFMHSTTLPAKSGLGQKHLVSEFEEQPVGSQVLRQRGRISGQGTSGTFCVGGASGAEEDAGGAGGWVAGVSVEGGAAVQRVHTVEVEVMMMVETVVAMLVKVEEPDVVVSVTGQVVSVVMTISVVMSVVAGGGGGASTSVGVVVGGGGGGT